MRRSWSCSESMEIQPSSQCGRDHRKVIWVARDDEVPAGNCPDDHGRVDDVIGRGATTCCPCSTTPYLGQVFDRASGEQPRQLSLRTSTPSLTEHAGRHGRRRATFERSAMKCPES